MKLKKILLLLVVLMLSTSNVNAEFENDKIVFKTADWKVFRDIDPMKDTVNCTGIHKDDFSTQLVKDTLSIRVRGGVESITLRFDDNTAENLRWATRMEKDIRAVIIRGSDFDKLLNSSRLRIQISTLISGIQFRDLNLTGIKDVVDNMTQGCPASTK